MGKDTLSRRGFLKAAGVGAASIVLQGRLGYSQSASSSDSPDKPNIVVILADDLGYGDVGCYGNTTIKTPNIDALAAEGMRFTDFHSNGPMCSPTRAALLTGRYQQRCGIEGVLSCKSDYNEGMALSETTFAEVLKSAGYATAMYGKWHLGFKPEFNPVKQGFDEFVGFASGDSDYHSHINRSGEPDWWKNDKLKPEEGYTTDLLSYHACRFIEANKNRPFCIYLPYQAVHFPYQGSKDKAERVVGGNYWSNTKYGSRYANIEDRKAAYKEMVEALDAGVGRIAATLKRFGLEKKTLLFCTSDNGAYSWVGSNLPCSGQKAELLEGGHRVPAVAWRPGKIKAGTVSDETTLTMDLFPTMVEIAGAKLPQGLKLDGVSLLPLLTGGKKPAERTVFWRFKGQHAVRRGPWKLLVRAGKEQLFNLVDDIGEKNDLSAAKPEMVKAMKDEFAAWEKDVTAGVKWIA